MDVTPPTTGEIKMAIRQINSGKAARPDNIPVGAPKSDIEVTAKILPVLFRKIGEEDQVPIDCEEGYLTKIPRA
ncbi:unnamed protein product [Schistosoma curassoni]|uniref:AFP-like domain-containing protein n=1 Tax=Schistosoma curassoni TaxID=6186 RepID=A0A183KTU3_9TREM|nr:unnamed protein product [Schistosoma curassoni]